MIFEKDHVVFQILDVFNLEYENEKTYNANRNFDALSLRLDADTTIETASQRITLATDSICYFPSTVPYLRTTKKDKLIVIHFKTYNDTSNSIEYFRPEDSTEYRRLFQEILNVWNKKELSYKHDASAILNRIFGLIYQNQYTQQNINSKIAASINYIDKNYLNLDFSLQIAAQKSLISETYFRKLFKQQFGVSPKKYVIEQRIKHAASLIITGYFSLYEISIMCGYDDYKYFSSEFKKMMGVSPSRYRYNYN